MSNPFSGVDLPSLVRINRSGRLGSGSGEPPVSLSFEMTVETTGVDETFTLPFRAGFNYDCVVDWGDGNQDTITVYNDPAITHTYSKAGENPISITGLMETIYFNNGGDALKVKNISNWGDVGLKSLERAFQGCTNAVITATGNAHMEQVTSMAYAFYGMSAIIEGPDFSGFNLQSCTTLAYMCAEWINCTTPPNLNGIQTPNVTDMQGFLAGMAITKPPDFSTLDTSKVTQFYRFMRFCDDLKIDPDMSMLDTSSATSFYEMFILTGFSVDVSSWNIEKVTTCQNMFHVSGFTTTDYDKLLLSWSQQAFRPNVVFHAGTATKYTEAAARQVLTDAGWIITDGGPV